jgi:Holliday junction resolvasome RuvABC ATP-dependent DNA helicase subunit
VSFSFKSAKDLAAKSRELERIAYRMLRAGGRL